jgi:AraC-like DNA-binding protein
MLDVPARSRLPLSRYPCLDISSLDEASDMYSRMTAPVRIHGLPGRMPFVWRAHSLALGPLQLLASETSSSVWADCAGASDAHLLSLSLGDVAAETTIGQEVTPLVRHRSGLICAPWQGSRVVIGRGYRTLQISVPRQAALDAMTTLTGTEPREVQFHRRLALDSPRVEPFLRLVGSLLRDAESEHPRFAAPGEAGRMAEALLFRLLLAQPHTLSSSALLATDPGAAEPRHVRCAAEYIDAHLDGPLTMADLCRVTGVSARWLQAGFLKHRGCSPLEFLRARRLERARALLLASDTIETVSEAALLAGLEHLGRFSVSYRARYGESPSRTLARRWRPAR